MEAEPRSVRFSPLAEQDIEEIWAYTARTWSTDQAGRYHAGIMDAIGRLARGDRVGRNIGDIRPGYLKYFVGRHFIFYRLTSAHLDVMRILHQSMDVGRRLQGHGDDDD